MRTDSTKATADAAEATLFLGDDWFDPLEAGVRTRIRGFIEELLEAELDVALGRDRCQRPRLANSKGRSTVQVFTPPFDCRAIFLSPHADSGDPPAR